MGKLIFNSKLMIFTDKQFKELQEAESYFETMVKADFKRNTPRVLDEKVHRIYQEATGVDFRINYSCSVCIGKLYKLVGKLYLEDKAKRVDKGTEPSATERPRKPKSSKVVANKEKRLTDNVIRRD